MNKMKNKICKCGLLEKHHNGNYGPKCKKFSAQESCLLCEGKRDAIIHTCQRSKPKNNSQQDFFKEQCANCGIVKLVTKRDGVLLCKKCLKNKPLKDGTFNLSEKRMEYYRILCRKLPDIKWALLFDVIKKQDKEFIKKVKEGCFWCNGKGNYEDLCKGDVKCEECGEIDKLAGKELLE